MNGFVEACGNRKSRQFYGDYSTKRDQMKDLELCLCFLLLFEVELNVFNKVLFYSFDKGQINLHSNQRNAENSKSL